MSNAADAAARMPTMYGDLAWFHLLTAPEEYSDEAAFSLAAAPEHVDGRSRRSSSSARAAATWPRT